MGLILFSNKPLINLKHASSLSIILQYPAIGQGTPVSSPLPGRLSQISFPHPRQS